MIFGLSRSALRPNTANKNGYQFIVLFQNRIQFSIYKPFPPAYNLQTNKGLS